MNPIHAEVHRLAELGYKLFPCHNPILQDGKVTGCTCEEYKRSDKYREYLENKGRGKEFDSAFKCANQGKHPRVGEWESKATSDVAQLATWFAKPWRSVNVDTGRPVWLIPNVGLACGPSGILVLDRDSYKPDYVDLELSVAEQTTVTQHSGGGGEQLWYAMPEDRRYTNSPAGLPACNDIRGWGGFVVVAPSLHKSGRTYEWEEGYSPFDMTPSALPATVRTILDSNRANYRTVRKSVEASSAGVARSLALVRQVLSHLQLEPTVEGWGSDGHKVILSQCPFNPEEDKHPEDRGAYVCVHSDGAISAGCHHNRCQQRIAQSELSGWNLLKQIAGYQPTVGNQPDAFDQLLAMARQFVKTVSFAQFIDDKYKAHIYQDKERTILARIEYRTDSTDTKLADALLDLVAQAHSFTVYASYETLRHDAGLGSKATVKAALERLSGWLIEGNETAPAADQARTYRVRIEWIANFVARRSNAIVLSEAICVRSTRDKLSTYSAAKGTDPFLLGRSRTAKRLGLLMGSLGETSLRIVDILESDPGGWTRSEIGEECAKSLGGLGRCLTRLEELEIVYSERENPRQPKQYFLDPDAWVRIDTLTPTLKTYRLSAERKERALAEQQRRAEIQLDMAQKAATVHRKAQQRSDIIAARRRYLAIIHPDWSSDEILKWILSPLPNARPWVDAKRARDAKDAAVTARHLTRQQVSPALAYRMVTAAGYTPQHAQTVAELVKEHRLE